MRKQLLSSNAIIFTSSNGNFASNNNMTAMVIITVSAIALSIIMSDKVHAFHLSMPIRTKTRNIQQQLSFVQVHQKYTLPQLQRSLKSRSSTTSIRDSLMDGIFDMNNNNKNSTIECNDFDIFDSTNYNDNKNDDLAILQRLRSRVEEISSNEQTRINRIRTGSCTSTIASIIPDWIRRINIGTYPIAVCGSASSTLFVTHLESGIVLASNEKHQQTRVNDNTNDDDVDESINEHTIRLLYGQYDGGGTISVAMSSLNSNGAIVADGRRYGGVGIYRFDSTSSDLLYQGSIPTLDNCIATSLYFDNDNNLLWISTDTGYVYAYSTENDIDDQFDDDDDDDVLMLPPLVAQTEPKYKWKIGSTVLSLSVNTELSCAVATAESGYVYLLSLDNYKNENRNDDKVSILKSFLPPYDSTERRSSHPYCTCATLVVHPLSSISSITQPLTATKSTSSSTNKNNDDKEKQMYSIVCGTNDGTIYVQTINQLEQSSEIDFTNPFTTTTTKTTSSTTILPTIRKMMPSHLGGAVKCITNIPNTNGLVATCGYDGSLRMWDVSSRDNLYQFLGYKVWIGSVWSDGYRIVSDGADNTIIQHDFSIPSSITTSTGTTSIAADSTGSSSTRTRSNKDDKKNNKDNNSNRNSDNKKTNEFENGDEFM